jgi:hypothetical protein
MVVSSLDDELAGGAPVVLIYDTLPSHQGEAADFFEVGMRDEWEERARDLVRRAMSAKGVTYPDLARLLTEAGNPETDQNLRNKLGRGTFTVAFLLQVIEVLRLDIELAERRGQMK